ncbi:DUF4464 domain-containing protein [archaeon]|nr:MAG: DUF4464 domain-containing protein [archaeon]
MGGGTRPLHATPRVWHTLLPLTPSACAAYYTASHTMAASDADAFEVRDKVVSYSSYEDYLDSQVSEVDMFYLEDEDLARQLVGTCAHATRISHACVTPRLPL